MHMRLLLLLTTSFIAQSSPTTREIDLSVCPDGLTPSNPDPQWPKVIPSRFHFFAEMTYASESSELSQTFLGPSRDHTRFFNGALDLRTYDDFELNERLEINQNLECERQEIVSNEYLPFVVSEVLKPSVLLGFDGRNNVNSNFATHYVGKTLVRDGLAAKKFQSCFYLAQEDLTINATYYITDLPPHQTNPNANLDLLQIDIFTKEFSYTYNVIRFYGDPSLAITTPAGVYCPNRTNTKPGPTNLPTQVSLHAEAFTLKNTESEARIESYNRLIDERLQVERTDYSLGKIVIPAPPSTSLIDYATNVSYLYTRDTQQCTAMNISRPSMPSTSDLLFLFGSKENAVGLQYTGIVNCGREFLQCHRWIDQRDLNTYIQQFEWYWSARFNQLDLNQLLPIKVNMQTKYKVGAERRIDQEINFFNYDPSPNSLVAIDNTLGDCYRALGPSHQFNYAVLRFTLNNDNLQSVHRHLFSLQRRLHLQLAADLKIRHLRLTSFIIDTTRDATNGENKNVYVTFTLLENPPIANESRKEPPSIQLMQQLSNQINDGKFSVRDEEGAYELTARPYSLQSLALYLSPSDNQTYYVNRTVIVYENVTQTTIRQRPTILNRNTGPQITALWTGFALLGLVVALGIGSFVAIRKWTPAINAN